jgi:hypothetical protein
MSRLDTIKEQFPELNITIIDLFTKLDNTKSYKYLPVLCKLFGGRFSSEKISQSEIVDYSERLSKWGFDVTKIPNSQLLAFSMLVDFFSYSDMAMFDEFKKYMERGLIPNKDVTSYKNFEEISNAISLASIKLTSKELEKQVHIEYEDDKWLALRPLTFSASAKYGSGTKWCTTSQREKQYFERYWKNGALVYFINKETGYKFAFYKEGLQEGQISEMSFWNVKDNRVDFLTLNIDNYLFPEIKRISDTKKTNKECCTLDIIVSVEIECSENNYTIGRYEPQLELAPPQVLETRYQLRDLTVEEEVQMEEEMELVAVNH